MNNESQLLIKEATINSILRLVMNDQNSKNALSNKMISALIDAIAFANDDNSIKVIVIASKGNVYSAGHDLKEITQARKGLDDGESFFKELFRSCSVLMQADQKLSELTAATSIASTDTLYLVSGGTSKQITAATAFSTLPMAVGFGGKVSVTGTNTMTAPGAVDLTTNITLLSNPSTAGTLTIAVGTEGQIKIIIMTSTNGNPLQLDDANLAVDLVTFDTVVDTATLIYIDSKWHYIGVTATVTV